MMALNVQFFNILNILTDLKGPKEINEVVWAILHNFEHASFELTDLQGVSQKLCYLYSETKPLISCAAVIKLLSEHHLSETAFFEISLF